MLAPKLIVFDWDDTFTHGATAGYKACYHAIVEDLGIEISEKDEHDRIIAKWGSTHAEEIKSLTAGFDVDQAEANKIYEKHLFGTTFVDHLQLVSGAKELIQGLKEQGCSLAIATGLNGDLLRDVIMPKFGISPSCFSRIYSAYDLEDLKNAKPHPHMLETIMSELGFTSDETIMVGDATNDMRMAQAAGVEPVAVLTGHLTEEEAAALGVRYIIEDVSELINTLSLKNRKDLA